ncbi:nascent polypeptide-associated complex subunit alpha, muscle-specific form isoform X2 [Ixodes scapularis]|uniref:nascent polypeptide-associated complex subunit alpha, muscle-specific form isoform X2 n=1 Tax=Ixodes scapularis TaxID=6945 RepID=UPI001A9E37A3|nr:nascent polypeptide-associated complex subunit alpha, muscle-specific form isoform X2 [Ixodes scapularis]
MAALGGGGSPLGGPSTSRPPWERPPVASLNSCLSCPLCRGYLVDAVTLVKCLHSFCKSCILKHLETGSSCPVCELRLSKINMEVQLRRDEILQNIVYKAIPGLYQKEMKRRRDFYSSRSGKDERATLTPEEKGELDNSSSGRVIFSPDEAVSLSLEYKHIVSSRLEGGDSTPGTCNPAFKEPVKRYLNCPAAVTIALLQKFLRMKYGISSKYKVDIYYLDDILWSKYTLMDIAYIYRWKRDVPLQLFYRISENVARAPGPLPTGVAVTTVPPGLAGDGATREGAPQQQAQQQGPPRGDSSEGPAFLKDSVNFPGSSRSCKDAGTTPGGTDSTAKPLTTGEASDTKPACSDGLPGQAEPKVQSKADVAPTSTPPLDKSVPDLKAPTTGLKAATKAKTPAPVQTKDVIEPVPENCRQLAKAKPYCDQTCTVPKPPIHGAEPGSAERSIPTGAAKCEKDAPCRPTTMPTEAEKSKTAVPPLRLKVPAECLEPAKARVHDVPAAELPRTAAKASGRADKEKALLQVGCASTPSGEDGSTARVEGASVTTIDRPPPVPLPNGAAKDLLKDLSEKLKVKGIVLELDPSSKRASLGSATAVESEVDPKLVNHTATPTIEDVVEAVSSIPEPVVQVSVAAETVLESAKLQTCFSRAADKARAKINALKAAASLKETSKAAVAEKEANEVVGLSVTLRANRQGAKGQLDSPVDKPAQKVASVAVGPPPVSPCEKKDNVLPSELPAATTSGATGNRPVATAVPTYMTLSKSHPSLFHSSPRKRGRPRLATVNSLNEEIERAHMMAKRQQATAEKPKPAIPVITSLRIKPIPPPPPETPPPVDRAATGAEVPESERLQRRGSQSEVSEEKSDAEDSSGRRKSRRRRGPMELRNVVTQLKDMTLEKEQQAVTQEPLRNLPGGPPSPAPAAAIPEKITLRVTRDEKSNLKVEKQLRPAAAAVVAETLHDSGFCEDVVAEGSRSPASEVKPKIEAATKTVRPTAPREPPLPSPCRKPDVAAAAHHGSNKKDMRKSKRRSVEDWVNEQSKWVRAHKAAAAVGGGDATPSPKAAKEHEDERPKRRSSLEEPLPAKGQQRRGRKRTNPVKITKPDPVVDAQQEKAACGSPPLTGGAPEKKGTTTATPPLVEKAEPSEAPARCPAGGPREPGKSRRELESPPKKLSELVIPRYIPNPATSIPLTITHARNKRLRETDKAPESGLDLSTTHSVDAKADGRGKDSEKSKFFKEALNLSMKETGGSKGVQNQTGTAGKVAGTELAMVPSGPPPPRPSPPTSPKRVSRPIESPGHRDGTASQINILRVVEKIASQNSRRTREDILKSTAKDGVGLAEVGKPARAEKSLPTEKGDSLRPCGGATSKADEVSTTSRACTPVPPVEKDSSVQAYSVTSTKQPSVLTASSTLEAQRRSVEPPTPNCSSLKEKTGAGIIPRINQTGVFRLEFPGADVSDEKPSSPTGGTANTAGKTEHLSADIELQKQQGVAALCAPVCTVSESLKNIARIKESIMGLQRQGTAKPARRSQENHKDEAPPGCNVNGERPSSHSERTSCASNLPQKNFAKTPPCTILSKIDDVKMTKSERNATGSSPSGSTDLSWVGGEKLKVCNKVKEGSGQPVVSDSLGQTPSLRTEDRPSKSASSSVCPTPAAAASKTAAPHPSRSLEMLTQRLRKDLEKMRKEKSLPRFASGGCQKTSEPRIQKPLDLPSMAKNTDTGDCTQNARSLGLPMVCGEKQLSMQTIPQQPVYNSVFRNQSCGGPNEHIPKTDRKSIELETPQSRKSPALADSFTKCRREPPNQSCGPVVAESKTSSKKEYFEPKLSTLSLPDVSREDSLQSPDTSSEKKSPSTLFQSLVPRDSAHKETALQTCPENPARPTSAPLRIFTSPFLGRDNLQRRYSEEGSSETPVTKKFEQHPVTPQVSEDKLEIKPRERCKSEGQRISSSNEVFGSEASRSEETAAIPSPKASEHMYRTTVAEIDLFTTLTIIDTMKGRATVYDIIDDYITNLGGFFGALEASPEAARRPIEEAFRSKQTVLLKIVGLLKKLTSSLSSSQLTRVFALENLVERFLVRTAFNEDRGAAAAASEPGDSGVEGPGAACGGTVLLAPQTSYGEDLEEPPLVSIPELEIPIVPILRREFSFCASSRKKRVKRLRKCDWNMAELFRLGRKPTATLALPRAAICRRFLAGWRTPALVGGSFSAIQPRPSMFCSMPPPLPDVCGRSQELTALCRRSLQLPQLSTMMDALSSLLTGSYFCLVNHTPPTNGQHRVSPIPVTLLPPETFSNVLSTFRRQDLLAPNLQEALLLMLSRLLCDHRRHGSGASRQPQQSPVPFQNRARDPLAARTGGPGLILVHAAADSSLVISSPQSNSKLVISPDLNQQLLTGLVNRLSSLPKTSAQVRHWLDDLAVVASGARRMLAAACHSEAPDQRIRGTSGSRGELRPAAVDTIATSQRFLRKRRAVADCKASPTPKRRNTRVEDPALKDDGAGCSWSSREAGAMAVAGASDSPPAPAVPKDCVVLLQRLNPSDVDGVTLKRRLRCRAARGPPKKKPKLSAFPALPGASR